MFTLKRFDFIMLLMIMYYFGFDYKNHKIWKNVNYIKKLFRIFWSSVFTQSVYNSKKNRIQQTHENFGLNSF